MRPKWQLFSDMSLVGGIMLDRRKCKLVVGGKWKFAGLIGHAFEAICFAVGLGGSGKEEAEVIKDGARYRISVEGLSEEVLDGIEAYCDERYGSRVRGFRRLLQ